jgi:transcription elongation factor GreA
MRSHEYYTINHFIERVIPGAKQYPEIFIWIAKNLLTGTWNYDWLDYSENTLTLTYFRLMNELKKIEVEGNRLKNMMLEFLFDDNAAVLRKIAARSDRNLVSKIFDIFENLSYIEESQLAKFEEVIKERFGDMQISGVVEDEWKVDVEKLIVSKEGYEKKKSELDYMVNTEMTLLSKELADVSEASGDIRENVDYTALLEKQTVLKVAIARLDDEMKRADILDVDKINPEIAGIGTRVVIKSPDSGETTTYTILGPWDADFEKGILSYRSPIAKAMLGKKSGDDVVINIDEEEKVFKIVNIERYC